MADKTHQGWNRDEIAVLIASTKQLQSDIDTQLADVKKLFAEILGDEVIAECKVKEPMIQGISEMESQMEAMGEKFAKLSKSFDEFAAKLGNAITTNIRNSEDAVAVLHKAAQQAKEATGAKA